MTTTLITGATGTIGNQVARVLLERGDTTVKVATRRPEAAADLAKLGADVVTIDLEDTAGLAGALAGVDRLFLVGPQGNPNFGADVAAAIGAAKQAGVGFVLRLSAFGADANGDFVLSKQHGLADQHLADSGLAWAALRPTFFQDNVIKFQGPVVSSQGAFYGASKTGRTAYVSSADIAAAAAEILGNPDAHNGQVYELTGPQAMTDAELAQLLTATLGKPIDYVDITPEQLAQSMRDNGTPEWMVQSMIGLEGIKSAGYAAAISPQIETLLGRPPEQYAAFLERNRARLS